MDKDHKWDLTDAATKIAIGRLVIKLVIDGMPIPETAEERLALLEAHGIRFNGDTDDVEIHRSTPSHMHLTLPPREYLERGLDKLADPERSKGYRVPREYADFHLQSENSLDPLTMYQFRIGDYTLSHCT